MSSASLHTVKCPKCNKEQTIERYNSINDYHRELFPKIADKTIFDYKCSSCNETIHEPYPLLFHKMGFRDIQIGYRFPVIGKISLDSMENPIVALMKKVMEDSGHEAKDIAESYEDEDEFAKRVAEFIS